MGPLRPSFNSLVLRTSLVLYRRRPWADTPQSCSSYYVKVYVEHHGFKIEHQYNTILIYA